MTKVLDERVGKVSEICMLRLEHPEFSLQEIANRVSMSRERVRQLLVREGLHTRSSRIKYLCRFCGKPCAPRRKYCDAKCWKAHSSVIQVCDYCGLAFARERKYVKRAQKDGYKHSFCNNRCKGKWFGKHFGRNRKESS